MASHANREMAEAFFKQACFDYFRGQCMGGLIGLVFSQSLRLAQFQQAAEKSLKAAILLRTEEFEKTHAPWRDMIASSKELRALKNDLLTAISPFNDESSILRLEGYVPDRDATRENTEYPWHDGRSMIVPAEHFQSEFDQIEEMRELTYAMLCFIKGTNRNFEKTFELVHSHFRN